MHVVKIVEIIGSSSEGWKEAAQAALQEASKTVKNIKSIHLKKCTAKVKDKKIVEYRAVVKVACSVEHER